MYLYLAVLLTLIIITMVKDSEPILNVGCPNVKTPLGAIRKRRHLAFPVGSDVVVSEI